MDDGEKDGRFRGVRKTAVEKEQQDFLSPRKIAVPDHGSRRKEPLLHQDPYMWGSFAFADYYRPGLAVPGKLPRENHRFFTRMNHGNCHASHLARR